jgi:hypothetical protein
LPSGADDIFVLYDAFMQAPDAGARRLSYALRRAVSAMSVTSITTFAAFVVTGLSPIMNIQVFGIFAAMLVACNFILCCMLTPILIILVHTGRCCCSQRNGGKCCCSVSGNAATPISKETSKKSLESQSKSSSSSSSSSSSISMIQSDKNVYNHGKTKKLRTIEFFFHQVLAPFVIRYKYIIFIGGMGLIGGFGSQALLLAPSEKGIGDIWPDTHVVATVSNLKSTIFLKGT